MERERKRQKFLTGVAYQGEDPQQRFRWSDLLKHPFVKDASAEMDELCAHTASPRGFGGAVRRDEMFKGLLVLLVHL
ncbi:hypothetical protein OROMI_004980 [Orobanche minor]